MSLDHRDLDDHLHEASGAHNFVPPRYLAQLSLQSFDVPLLYCTIGNRQSAISGYARIPSYSSISSGLLATPLTSRISTMHFRGTTREDPPSSDSLIRALLLANSCPWTPKDAPYPLLQVPMLPLTSRTCTRLISYLTNNSAVRSTYYMTFDMASLHEYDVIHFVFKLRKKSLACVK